MNLPDRPGSPPQGPGAAGDTERGQATVEFALLLPLVLLLTVAVVQVARVCALQVAVVDAARAGARVATVDRDPDAVRAAAGASQDRSVQIRTTAGDPELVTVQVSRPVRLLPGLGLSTVRLAASSTMAVEPQR